MGFHCKLPIFYILVSLLWNFLVWFLLRLAPIQIFCQGWESSCVSDVKAWVCFDILFLFLCHQFFPIFIFTEFFVLVICEVARIYVCVTPFVNYVLLLENNFLIWILRRYFFFQKSFLLLYLWWVLIFNVIWFLSSVLHMSICVFIS